MKHLQKNHFNQHRKRLHWGLAAFLCLPILGGCSKSAFNEVSIASRPFVSSALGSSLLNWLIPSAVATTNPITSFKICVNRLKVEGPEGQTLQSDDGNELFDARLGLIDIGDGTKSVNWGTISLPSDASIRRIKIKIHKDPQACSNANYSVSVNGQTMSKDLEFIFRFQNPKPIGEKDTVRVALNQVVAQLTAAATANELNDEKIERYLNGSVEDDATVE